MAAKSKKRLSKIENKLLKLEKLELNDVFCSICQSILIEPVTLPCFHDFCQRCFKGSVENNALCCPLCRLRIGSWLRTATKQNRIVNIELWNFIKSKFSKEIDIKLKGDDLILPEELPIPRLSEPGEIRSEYEAEIQRLRVEREKLEQKHLEQTEILIKQIQKEEKEAYSKYLHDIKQDEVLALKMQQEQMKASTNVRQKTTAKTKLKATKLDSHVSKVKAAVPKNINRNTDSGTPTVRSGKTLSHASPEMVPSYSKLLKNFLEKKIKNATGIWNKENGENASSKSAEQHLDKGDCVEDKVKTKPAMQSLLVSLPLPACGIKKRSATPDDNTVETGSVDSMRQELCYFKPIEGTTPTSFSSKKGLPVRVPGVRLEHERPLQEKKGIPSRLDFVDSLCLLRNISLSRNLPSAFVLALNMLKVNKESPEKCETFTNLKLKATSPSIAPVLPVKKILTTQKLKQANGNHLDSVKLSNKVVLRRTRSMGSISKDDNETTPKKTKITERKVSSERKPYLRSDSKRLNAEKAVNSPPLISENNTSNKINLAVKNLSSPLKNCDVKKILQEQFRIEKIIEQEKNDFEMARKIDVEWNGRRQPRRNAIKRQVTLNYALRPAKKLKV